MKIPVVVICGPTASGKTALAIEVAKRFDGEVVSADSMQIYRTMDIGTAKPTEEEKRGIVHHMIDVVSPEQNYSVSDYCEAAHKVILDIYNRGKLPVVAGGTGLYIDSLINNLDFSQSVNDKSIRLELEKIAEENGKEYLHEMLRELDADSANAIHMNNVKRVIRAIEHIKITGEKFSDYKRRAAENESPYAPLYIFINVDRELLYERINMRVDIMMDAGLEEEALNLYKRDLPRELTAFGGIGYKELFEYFDGNCTLEEAVEAIKQGSRRYAKRQLTWFRKNEHIINVSFGENLVADTIELTDKFLKEFE